MAVWWPILNISSIKNEETIGKNKQSQMMCFDRETNQNFSNILSVGTLGIDDTGRRERTRGCVKGIGAVHRRFSAPSIHMEFPI